MGSHQGRNPRIDLLLVAIITLVALTIRGVYIAQQHSDPLFDRPTIDAEFWHAWSSAFAAGERFESGPYYRAPLYAWTLGAVYKTLGAGPLAWRAVQAVLGALTCGLVYLIGLAAFSRVVGLVAGLTAASYWMLVYFTGEMLIPTLAVFLNTALVLFLLAADRRRSPAWWAWAGIVLGLSAITRPNILLFAPVIVLWMLVSRRTWRQFLTDAAAITIACLLVVLPVTVRNAVVGDDVVLISAQGGANLYIGNNPEATGINVVMPGTSGHWFQTALDQKSIAEQETGRQLKPSEVSRFFAGKSLGFMRAEPVAAAQLMLWKLWCFWSGYEFANNKDLYAYTQRYTPMVKLLPLGFGVVAPLGLLGVAVIWPRRRELFPLWGFLLVYMLSIVLFFVSARFRVPMLPVLILLATVAGDWIVRTLRKKDWRSVAEAGVALAILLYVCNSTKWEGQPNWVDLRHAAYLGGEGRIDEAIEVYSKIIRENPDNYHALADSALLLLKRSELDAAQANARRAVRVNGEDSKGHKVLGQVLVRQGSMDEALVQLNTAVRLLPINPNNQRELGHALLLKGDPVGASTHLLEALRLSPGHPRALASLGMLAAQAGNVEEAVAAFEASTVTDPTDAEVYLAWAIMYERLGRKDEAVAIAQRGSQHVAQRDRAGLEALIDRCAITVP